MVRSLTIRRGLPMKYIAVLFAGFLLAFYAPDERTNALIGLMIVAVIINTVIDDMMSFRRRYAAHRQEP
jgi:hypothetical protein